MSTIQNTLLEAHAFIHGIAKQAEVEGKIKLQFEAFGLLAKIEQALPTPHHSRF